MDKILVRFNLKEDISDSFLSEILTELAVRIEQKIKDKFENRAMGSWKPRAVPNIVGILKDLSQSANVKQRRFTTEQTGIDTGVLRNSIGTGGRFIQKKMEGSEVGSEKAEKGPGLRVEGNKIYIEMINYGESFAAGGRKRIDIAPDARKNLTEWKKKNEKVFEVFPQLGVLFSLVKKPFYEFMTPARPLLLKEDVQILAEDIFRDLDLL